MENLNKEELTKLKKLVEGLLIKQEQEEESKYNNKYSNIFESIKDSVRNEEKANVLVIFDCIHKHKEFLDYVDYFKTDLDEYDYFFNDYKLVRASGGFFKISCMLDKSINISIVYSGDIDSFERSIIGYSYTDLIFCDYPSYFDNIPSFTEIIPDLKAISILK